MAWAVAVAAAVASLAALPAVRRRLEDFALRRSRVVLAGLALAAALLSAGYLREYLRGGPRIIDATSYYLQARALAEGFFSFPTPDPSGSFRGRFLLTPPDATTLSVLFPPGYPAVLALGWWLGAPLAIGPVIGAALVVATHALARQLFRSEPVALLAALLSVLSGALRYHTADTMSHGWAALLLVGTLLGALRGDRWQLVGGLACGWLIATRPVTGAVALGFAVLLARRSGRIPWPLLAGLVPGVLLLLLHQRSATGSWLGSAQLRYYALADGPLGCFRYGFGAGVGCLHEHGDFVATHLPNGFGAAAALGTTGRRAWQHVIDVANAWPLALLIPFAAVRGRNDRGVRLLAALVVALVAAYAPFYFDGNYPGGGARLYAEALPLEHVLVAWGAIELGIARFVPAAALAGFAFHAAGFHAALRAREGGRPMFEPSVLERAGVRSGVLFTGTDHGFALGHRPGRSDPSRDVVVARHRGDAHDWLLWNQLGRPPTYRYVFGLDPGAPSPRVEPYAVPESFRFQAEAEWPPLAVEGGYALYVHPAASCARGSAALGLRGGGDRPVTITVEVGAISPGAHRLVAGWVALADGPATVGLTAGGAAFRETRSVAAGSCWESPPLPLELGPGSKRVQASATGSSIALDWMDVRPAAQGPDMK